jgi:hypothetical protein
MRALRTLRALALVVVLVAAARATGDGPRGLKVDKAGETYTWAQVSAWLDRENFVVGRWDGTITLFRPPVPMKEFGPVTIQALKIPSGKGVEMLQRLGTGLFVTSNDETSLAVWEANKGEYRLKEAVKYDPKFGTANSATLVRAQGTQWLITGHAEGFLLTWEVEGPALTLRKDLNIRSKNPIPAPFRAWNVRSVVPWKGSTVITGGEDGDLCVVDPLAGTVLSRVRYNQIAQRGINSLSVSGEYLLLGNCSVGKDDKNLWLYRVKDDRITPLDSANIVKATDRKQVFNFCVQLVSMNGTLYFLASTEEGLLWRGEVEKGKLSVAGSDKVEAEGGASLAFEPENAQLVVVAHAIRLFKLSAK